jgi:hypothetical protein
MRASGTVRNANGRCLTLFCKKTSDYTERSDSMWAVRLMTTKGRILHGLGSS